jgi:hypothetical protein
VIIFMTEEEREDVEAARREEEEEEERYAPTYDNVEEDDEVSSAFPEPGDFERRQELMKEKEKEKKIKQEEKQKKLREEEAQQEEKQKKLREEEAQDYEQVMGEEKRKQEDRFKEIEEEKEKRRQEIGLSDKTPFELSQVEEQNKQKRIREEAERKRSEMIKKAATRGDFASMGLLGTQVGAMLGFTRHGVVGKQISKQKISKQKIADKGEEIKRINEYIGDLKKQKKSKLEDKKLDEDKKIKDVNQIMKEITKMTQLKEETATKHKQMEIAEARDDSIKYTRVGASKPTGKGVKGKGRYVDSFGIPVKRTTGTSKKRQVISPKFGKRFESSLAGIDRATGSISMDKIIQNLNKISQQGYTTTPSRRMIPADDDNEINETNDRIKPMRPTNEFGVDDWIVNL